jgi:hypothetical protein
MSRKLMSASSPDAWRLGAGPVALF